MTAEGHALKARVMSLEIRMGKMEEAVRRMWNEVPRDVRESIIEDLKGDQDEPVRR